MALDIHYKALVGRASASLEALIADSDLFLQFTSRHNYAAEFEKLISVVENRPEAAVFKLALKEFHYALYACASGSYRHGHIGLRLFFELFSAGILFSAHEIKLRLWLSGAEGSDISWSTICSPETGIFSTHFLSAFNSDMSSSGKQYKTIAITVYRECSEFVHGNINTQKLDDKPILYQRDILEAWMERAEAIRICIMFSFAGRYIRFLDKPAQSKIEHIMIDNFGHLAAIQAIYS